MKLGVNEQVKNILNKMAEWMFVGANLLAMIVVFVILVVSSPIWGIPYLIKIEKEEKYQNEQRQTETAGGGTGPH